MSKLIACPNHNGAYDCTPFCELCEGEQEIIQYTAQEIREQVLLGIRNLERHYANL